MLDLRLKDEMVKEQWRNPRPQIEMDIETWQITFDANKTARNQVDWDKVEGKELEERKEFHRGRNVI